MSRRGLPIDLRSVRERLQVSLFRIRLSYSRQRGTLNLAKGSLLSVLAGLALLAGSLLVDSLLLSKLGVVVPRGMGARVPPLLTVVASLTGLIALAVSVSIGPVQSALTRFPADVSAPLLEDEPRDGLLSLVAVTFTLALGSLLTAVLKLATPFTGLVLVAALGVATLAALVGYVKQRVSLFDPTNLAHSGLRK